MKLPRYTATTPPPRESGVARAQDIGALTRTGGQEFKAIAQAGEAIQKTAGLGFRAYMDRQALDDQQKMGEISIKAQEAEKQGRDSIGLIDMAESRPLPNDPDYYKGDKIPDSETWAKSNESVFADYKKKIISLSTAIKNPKTRQAWINTRLVRGSGNFNGISRAKYNEYQESVFLNYAETAASNGDIKLANQWIDIAEKHGLIGPKKAAAERDKNTENYIVGLYRKGNYVEARKILEASSLGSKQKERLDDEIDTDERSVILKVNTADRIKYKETERELHQQFINGTLTSDQNNEAFKSGKSDVSTHRAYDTIIKNKELTETDSVLSEKWLNGSLTKSDITKAQKEGRLNNSSVVGAWLSRLNQGQFNAGAYDRALTKIRDVRFNKDKYDDVRLYLLKNAEDLGGKWTELRNKLETAMNTKGDATGSHVQRAHGLIDKYAKDNPEINDGTLDSVRRIQQLHDSVDARADQTPEQMRNTTQALLLPYEEEKAKGWFRSAFETVTKYSPIGIVLRGSRKTGAKKQKVFQSVMLIQPVSKAEFNKKVISLKSLFGDDSKEAKQFYDRYVDSYEWETE